MFNKSTFSRSLGAIFCIGATVCTVACGKESINATALMFTNENITLAVGETVSLKYLVTPKAALNGTAYWHTDNNTIAYVRNGNVIGVSAGKTNIYLNLGGLEAKCTVTVIDAGGGGTTERIVLSSNSLNLEEGGSTTLKAYVNPSDAKVTWSSNDPSIATVNNGVVTAIVAGTTKIVAKLDSGLSAECAVTVIKKSVDPTPGPSGDEGWTGTIRVGAPLAQKDFMTGLLADFNTQTKSSVTFEVTQWEEDKGPDNFTAVLSEGPDIYPYISDQTVRFYQRQALADLPSSAKKWIKSDMGNQAYDYATLAGSGKTVGYPFASDNGYVMFYSKKMAANAGITDMNDITMEELLDKAAAKDYEVDYAVSGGFYASGALMSYNNGVSMYELTMKSGGSSYSVKSSFDTENGLKAGKMIKRLYSHTNMMNMTECPGSATMATIVDCSKVTAYKNELGSDYGCAALPYTDDTKTSRLGVFLGYKFYGINPGRAGNHIELAHAVAKFLTSEYAQRKRLTELHIRPTLTSLQTEAESEEHVKALNVQSDAKGIYPLKALDSTLWSNTATSVLSIKALTETGDALDKKIKDILGELDLTLTIN